MEKNAIAKHSFLKPVVLAIGYVGGRPVKCGSSRSVAVSALAAV
jgi:hypothetical protein